MQNLNEIASQGPVAAVRYVINKLIELDQDIEVLRQLLADALAKEGKAFLGERQTLVNEARAQLARSKKKGKGIFGALILSVRGKTTTDPNKQQRTIYARWRRIIDLLDRPGGGKKIPKTVELKRLNGDVHCGHELRKYSYPFERGDIFRLESLCAETRIAWRIMSFIKQRHVRFIPGFLKELDQFPARIEQFRSELFPEPDAQFPVTQGKRA